MSSLNLKIGHGSKKAKKVCQKLTFSLQSKLQKLQRSRMMEQATMHVNSAISTIIRCKKRLCKKLQHCHHHHHHHQHEYKTYWYGTVDEVCYSSTTTAQSSSYYSSSACETIDQGEVEVEDVNVRSDIFIAMNKELWRLENQRSIENYYKMLARGM